MGSNKLVEFVGTGRAWHAPFLGLDYTGLGEVMLQMLDTAQCHDALAFGSATTERFVRFVRRVYVRVESGLSARFLRCNR